MRLAEVRVQAHRVHRSLRLIEVEEAEHAVQALVVVVLELQLRADLLAVHVAPLVGGVEARRRQAVQGGGEIEVLADHRLQIPVVRDVHEREAVAQAPVQDAGDRPRLRVGERIDFRRQVARVAGIGAGSAHRLTTPRGQPDNAGKRVAVELERARPVVLVVVLAAQQDVERIAEIELQLCARHLAVEIVDLTAGDRVLAEAVAILALDRDPPQYPVRPERAAQRTLEVDVVVITVGEPRVAAQFLGRLGGDQVDRAADGIAAVQGALGPAQHLDALEVEERSELRLRARDDRAVHVQRDTGLAARRRGVRADAAYGELRHVEVVAEVDARHDQLQVLDVVDVRGRKPLAAQGRDRRADFLQRLLAFLRGDDDFLELRRTGHGNEHRGGTPKRHTR